MKKQTPNFNNHIIKTKGGFTMKKHLVLWMALAVMAWTWTAAAQVRTLTLNYNYSGAPTGITVQTDAHGNLMTPLPAPVRPHTNANRVWGFRGWYLTEAQANTDTSASVANPRTAGMVILGPTGTRFTSNTTIHARWTDQARPNLNDIPAAMRENFDWLRNVRHEQALPNYNTSAERIYFNANGSVRQRNSVFHMIWEGNGTINWVVRWESGRRITLAERQNMARMLHESINVWTRPLIGMPGWPFGEIPVTITGWAVRSRDVIVDPQPNEQIWVNSDHLSPFGDNAFPATRDFMASAPSNLSRFIQFGGSGNVNRTYTYPGGLHARFDMYQWVTAGFGGAVGGDWGNRLGDTRIIGYGSGVNAQGQNSLNGVQTHEVGHSFGLYDLYTPRTRMPPDTRVADATGNRVFGSGDLRTVMDRTYNGILNTYDVWQIRYYWDWVHSATPTNDRNRLFRASAVTVASTGSTGSSGGGTFATGQNITINAGTRSGHTFTGWTVSGAGVTLANANSPTTSFTMPANAVTVTANWSASTGIVTNYTISFNANNGTGTMSPDVVQEGNDYTIKANTFTRANHTFAGWNTAANGSGTAYAAGAVIRNVRSHITLFAQWTAVPTTYTITFNPQSGTVTPTSAVTGTNGRLSTLPTPTRAGFTFNGWFTAATGGTQVTTATVFTANATIFARWTALPTYTITFNPQSGTVTPTSAVTGTDGRLASLPTPTRAEFTFNGWFTAATGGTQVTTATVFTANTTIHARWTALPTYTITFNPQSGTVTPTTAVTGTNGRLTSLPTPTRAGFTFNGWFTTAATGGSQVTTTTVFTANATIHARWTAITYTVAFNANGGTGTMTSDNVTHGSNYTIKANTFTREEFIFAGWSTAATGGTNYAAGAQITNVTANITLFARWDAPTSVLSQDRIIPGFDKSNNDAPGAITALAAEFTAGPNPVAKSAGAVTLYRAGKRVDNAVLTVYDASGNAVSKIRISDSRNGDLSERRVIGTWDLTDTRGRQVSEGTYLVRGSVTVDGKRERVSVMVGVR